MKHKINLFLIFLTPVAAALAIAYQLIIRENISFLIILMGILPGAIISALKELRGILPPDKLIIEVDPKLCEVVDSTRQFREISAEAEKRETERLKKAKEQWYEDDGSERPPFIHVRKYHESDYTGKMITRGDTTLFIPIRLRNRDFERKIKVTDFNVELVGELEITMDENVSDAVLNNKEDKIIEPTSRADYKIEISHKGKPQNEYYIFLTFNDNYERSYKKKIIVRHNN